MAEYCTIYCTVLNRDEIARLLNSHFPSSSPASGDSMEVQGSEGRLRLTVKVFKESGDDFCRTILGIRAFVKRIESASASARQDLVGHLDQSDLAIGVVAEPAFDADERFHAVVFAIAKALDGVIFNGHEMLDANGRTLLTAD
ncbi:MAG: hypothetical protein NT069_33270 [Planctomycetota bacterium]|nr:hypothetical protein [Planctomycetota bacterium]